MTPSRAEFLHAIAVARRGDPQTGLVLARAALQRARTAGVPAAICGAMNALATCQAIQGAFIEAVSTALDTYRAAQTQGLRAEAVQALCTLVGATGFIVDSPPDSLAMLDRCLAEARMLGDAALEVRVRFLRGVVYFGLSQWEEAETEYRWVLASPLSYEAGIPPSLVHGNLANVSVRRALVETGDARDRRWQEAETRIAAALSMVRAEGNADSEARAWLNMGSLRLQQARYPEAETALETSLTLSVATRHRARIIDVLMRMGALYIAMERLDRAQERLTEAQREADLARPTPSLAAAIEGLAEVCSRRGEEALAAHYRNMAHRERDAYRRASEEVGSELRRLWKELSA